MELVKNPATSVRDLVLLDIAKVVVHSLITNMLAISVVLNVTGVAKTFLQKKNV
jgi:hypothetical protein